MQTFSQNKEQEVILKHFGESKGTFLDIGANDGMTLSNVYALALFYGWSGLLVEPSPEAYKRLVNNYSHFVGKDGREYQLLEVAIAPRSGKLQFFESGELLGSGDVALVSTAVTAETKRWNSINMPWKEMEVEGITFAELMARSVFKHFDLISIDIEGMELEILQDIDFASLGCRMAIIEWNSKNQRDYNKIMYTQGFRLIHTNAENLIYVK